MPDPAAIAVIGLGAMGLPIAGRLTEVATVRGYDVSPDRRYLAEERGVRAVPTIADAVHDARVTVLAVRDERQMLSVLFEPGGIAQEAAEGAVVILTSTVGPTASMTAADRLVPHGIRLVDAPVSGGARRAASGDLLVMVSGQQEAISESRAVLDAIGSDVHLVGDQPGAGQTMKVVNQLLCGVHIAAAAEAIALAHNLGLDATTVLEILGKGAAQSFMLADRGPRMVNAYENALENLHDVRSRLDVIDKDMGLVTQLARSAGIAAPLAAAAEQLYRIGMRSGLATLDDSAIITILT